MDTSGQLLSLDDKYGAFEISIRDVTNSFSMKIMFLY